MDLGPLQKHPPLDPPLHLLPLHEMVVDPILFSLPWTTGGVRCAESEAGRWEAAVGWRASEGRDDGALAYSGGTADYHGARWWCCCHGASEGDDLQNGSFAKFCKKLPSPRPIRLLALAALLTKVLYFKRYRLTKIKLQSTCKSERLLGGRGLKNAKKRQSSKSSIPTLQTTPLELWNWYQWIFAREYCCPLIGERQNSSAHKKGMVESSSCYSIGLWNGCKSMGGTMSNKIVWTAIRLLTIIRLSTPRHLVIVMLCILLGCNCGNHALSTLSNAQASFLQVIFCQMNCYLYHAQCCPKGVERALTLKPANFTLLCPSPLNYSKRLLWGGVYPPVIKKYCSSRNIENSNFCAQAGISPTLLDKIPKTKTAQRDVEAT